MSEHLTNEQPGAPHGKEPEEEAAAAGKRKGPADEGGEEGAHGGPSEQQGVPTPKIPALDGMDVVRRRKLDPALKSPPV